MTLRFVIQQYNTIRITHYLGFCRMVSALTRKERIGVLRLSMHAIAGHWIVQNLSRAIQSLFWGMLHTSQSTMVKKTLSNGYSL